MSVLADLFEQTQRMRRIQIWLDDIAGFADELAARTPDGELTSFADNEWLWNERGRLLHSAQLLLREVWLEGLSDGA